MSQGNLHWIFLQISSPSETLLVTRLTVYFLHGHRLLPNLALQLQNRHWVDKHLGIVKLGVMWLFFIRDFYFPLHEERNHLVGLVEIEGYYHLMRS